MPVVWTNRHRLHEPGGEIYLGVRTPSTEVPARAERIRDELSGAGARLVSTRPQCDDALLDVHDADLVGYLLGARLEGLGSGWADGGSSPGRVPVCVPPSRDPVPRRAHRAGGAERAGRCVRLRHYDLDRPGHLGGRAGGHRHRTDRRGPRHRRRARRLRLLPTAGPPRRSNLLRGLLLPEQLRGGRRAPPGVSR